MKRLPFLALLLVIAGHAFSADFGLLFNRTIEAEHIAEDTYQASSLVNDLFTFTPALTPWFSWNGDNGLSVYLSGMVSFRYSKYSGDLADNSGWLIIPELYRFALKWRINSGTYLEAGRIMYTDAMGFITGSFVDGLHFNTITPLGSISVGGFYTGFLYKETAKIIMTGSDIDHYVKPWGFDTFADYFASRRAIAALRWDLPIGEANNLSVEFLAQFDLNDSDDKLHSQYGEAQFEFYPISMLRITVAALFETMQNDSGDLGAAFGALAQLQADMPGSLDDRLGFTVKFTSGPTNDNSTAYTPLSSITQSAVLPGIFAGLCVIGADYNIKIVNSLLADCALRYFIRAYDDPAANGNMYGGELWASFSWQPIEDFRATFGAGAFFPGLGNVYPSGTDAMWKISAAVTLAL